MLPAPNQAWKLPHVPSESPGNRVTIANKGLLRGPPCRRRAYECQPPYTGGQEHGKKAVVGLVALALFASLTVVVPAAKGSDRAEAAEHVTSGNYWITIQPTTSVGFPSGGLAT